jgi:hypothetical protein
LFSDPTTGNLRAIIDVDHGVDPMGRFSSELINSPKSPVERSLKESSVR